MRKLWRQKWEAMQSKLASVGWSSLLCSFLLAMVTQIYTNFVFKVQYYRALSPTEQREWWFKLIDLHQASAFVLTPTAQILLFLTISTALFGLGMLSLAMMSGNKAAKRRRRESIEQWLKENPPQRKRRY